MICEIEKTQKASSYLSILLLLCLVCSVGCGASHADRAVSIRNAYYAGRLDAAIAHTELKGKEHDADVVKLNRAMVYLAAGEPAASEQLLREIRDRFDHHEDKTLIQKAAALATDDRKLPYAGEEYEKILIRTMLAISNMMYDGGDVNAYALQVTAKQQELLHSLQEKSKENELQVDLGILNRQMAVGSYFRAAILETSPLDYDDVQRCRVQVASWQPDFRDAKIDLARAETGRHSPAGHGVVYVITLVGKGPFKEEAVELPTTVSLLIADRILSAVGKYELPPNIAPVKVPVVVRSHQRIESVAVSEQGKVLGSTTTLMDISSLAVEQNRLQRNEVIARAVARRITKKGAVYAAKSGLAVQNSPEIDLLLTVAGVAWEFSERADTRCWSLLPDRIQVLRLELPVGQHQLDLSAHMRNGRLGNASPVSVDVQDGKTTFVLGVLPEDRVIGKVLTKIYR
ncbi:MAG: hypothetical protein JKY95_09300 [Planctomycetaceae bacterium]|nr:hypothetical protein [Planctomycetaceae bacterium]